VDAEITNLLEAWLMRHPAARQAKVVELRYGGLQEEEIVEVLKIAPAPSDATELCPNLAGARTVSVAMSVMIEIQA
jgi:hypothetical protein